MLSDLIWRNGTPSSGFWYDVYIWLCQTEYHTVQWVKWLCGHREPPEDFSDDADYDLADDERHEQLQRDFAARLRGIK